MPEITYVRGDATAPQGKGVELIAHIERRLLSRGIAVTVYDYE
ncbi:hypothetical protein OHA03_00685 [Streptomyces sp. NBC_00154]|jgi:hypothetical protein|nr:hypothetical protein [Streptomyces sp. NBC_00154]